MQIDEKMISKESEAALHGLAHQAYKTGDYQGAAPLYRLLTAFSSHNLSYWKGLAACLLMLKNFEEALAAYGYLALHIADDPYTYYHTAECHYGLGDMPRACKALDKAISVSRQDSRHYAFAKQLQHLLRRWQQS